MKDLRMIENSKKANCLNNHLPLLTIMIVQNIVIQKLSFPKKGSMAEWSKAWNVSEGENIDYKGSR